MQGRLSPNERRLRRDVMSIAQASLAAADAGAAVERHLAIRRRILRAGTVQMPLDHFDRIFALSIGKAAAVMAAALERRLGAQLTQGFVVTKHGHAQTPLQKTQVYESGHPIPDRAGLDAAMRVDALLRELNARDLLLVAISGGASALLPAPATGLTLIEKQATTNLLLECGATIGELNCVRKHLSFMKGGRLAALAYPATVLGLLLSDVVGDPLDVIGSGLTAPDSTTFEDALQVLDKYGLLPRVPKAVSEHLKAGQAGKRAETPKAGDAVFENVQNVVIGSNRLALEAARSQAKKLGYRCTILTSTLTGETREAAVVHAAILKEVQKFGSPVHAPACLLSGGETTVTIRGTGRGGRNQEFALAAAIVIDGLKDVLVLSLGTDGTDGPTDAAGALATGTTVQRAHNVGLEATRHLIENNAYPFFDALGDLVKTGATGTNVMDIQVLLAG